MKPICNIELNKNLTVFQTKSGQTKIIKTNPVRLKLLRLIGSN